jgi:hypothetical protein
VEFDEQQDWKRTKSRPLTATPVGNGSARRPSDFPALLSAHQGGFLPLGLCALGCVAVVWLFALAWPDYHLHFDSPSATGFFHRSTGTTELRKQAERTSQCSPSDCNCFYRSIKPRVLFSQRHVTCRPMYAATAAAHQQCLWTLLIIGWRRSTRTQYSFFHSLESR